MCGFPLGSLPDTSRSGNFPRTPFLVALPSAIQFDPDRWSDVSLHKGMVERCPGCRASSMFMKRDYYFCID